MSNNPYQPPDTVLDAVPISSTRELPEELFQALRQTRPWVVFISILGFITCGLMALGGLLLLIFGGLMSGKSDAITPWLGLVYVPFAAVYIPPSLFLFRYGSTLRSFLQDGSIESLTQAMRQQRSFWRYIGVLFAALIALYFVAIGVAVAVGFFSAAARHQ